ncbi:MAG: hypothetical protein QF672_13100 [SAR202 cluster bacterium]|nr:hypothetical protein [SAR202 cluster bacterium]
MNKPVWLELTDELVKSIFPPVHEVLDAMNAGDLHLAMIPRMALFHLSGCLHSSMRANEQGLHSAVICLVRQCVEALTLVDLGLQAAEYREPRLEAWDSGKLTHGKMRQSLEADVWARYGNGLWDESWTDYFGNLARSVQPYAHYSPVLMGWQMSVVDNDASNRFHVAIGPAVYDSLKASRITLLHSLVLWTSGRIVGENTANPEWQPITDQVDALGRSLGQSKLLLGTKNWADELAPHMLFRPGYDWRDA